MAAGSYVQSDSLQADAFKKLYPREFFSRFIEDGIRPDGRPIGRCRPSTIGLDVVSTADSSALVKIGSTTALAGVKLEVMPPKEDLPNLGQLVIQVEMTALASSGHRPGRFSEEAASIQECISSCLEASSAIHLEDLCIDPGRAAWCIYLDIYILDAAGALLDTALLAAIACLANMRLPPVTVNEQGNVVSMADKDVIKPQHKLQLHCIPLSVTCGTFNGKLLVDPTYEEEALLQTIVSTVIDGQSRLISGELLFGLLHLKCPLLYTSGLYCLLEDVRGQCIVMGVHLTCLMWC